MILIIYRYIKTQIYSFILQKPIVLTSKIYFLSVAYIIKYFSWYGELKKKMSIVLHDFVKR